MGTPEFGAAVLEALLGEHEVVGVYTREDRPAGRGLRLTESPVKRLAAARGLPVYQPRTLRRPEEQARLAELNPEAVVVAAFGLILPPEVLNLPPYGCLNVHPSLLPRHRGPAPVAAALLAGDEVTGVSIMLMDEGVDTGPVLARRELPILPEDDARSLTEKLGRLGGELLLEVLPRWQRGEIVPQPQDHSRATYSRMIRKEEGELDWRLPALELWRRVRAFNPSPGTWTLWRGRRLKVLSAFPRPDVAAEPGRVVALPGGVGVGTGQGVLELREVQLEGSGPCPSPSSCGGSVTSSARPWEGDSPGRHRRRYLEELFERQLPGEGKGQAPERPFPPLRIGDGGAGDMIGQVPGESVFDPEPGLGLPQRRHGLLKVAFQGRHKVVRPHYFEPPPLQPP